MTDDVNLERLRGESVQALLKHEAECERRYGKIDGRLGRQEALMAHNTRLLYLILAGMLAVAGWAFWPTMLGG